MFKAFSTKEEKIINALELPYSNAKLEATDNLIKVIKRNVFGFRKMKRQNSHFHCHKPKTREDKSCLLSV